MSKPLSTKKKIKIAMLLGGLGLVAIWTNADVLFGQPLQQIKKPNDGSSEPAVEAPPTPSASTEGGRVTANSLGQRDGKGPDSSVRNPFQTLKEQDPFHPDQATLYPDGTDQPDPEMPPGMRAQVIFIYGKNQKIASIEGRQVKEGESFYGGKILLIEPKLVTIRFKGGTTWLIPLGTEGVPQEKK